MIPVCEIEGQVNHMIEIRTLRVVNTQWDL